MILPEFVDPEAWAAAACAAAAAAALATAAKWRSKFSFAIFEAVVAFETETDSSEAVWGSMI